ncbi:hypothetical protein MJO29_005214 [Puccinia striiformis f. sp. tritici]|nr:hypothetical protein Pst134EB_010397 [Puccinia striiformis f. sp. tritici]KAI7960146.1 hypothetical protein MJO29_005214 [Puccinia striiformis f. sp. tritici]
MDQHLSYSPSQTRSPSVLFPQTLFSSSQAAYCASPVDITHGSLLNPYAIPVTRVTAPQSKIPIFNTQNQLLPPTLGSTFSHRTSLPPSYNMTFSDIFPSPAAAASANPTQSYYPTYSSYNGCPLAIPVGIPFTSTPFATQTRHQESSPSDDLGSTTVFVAGLPACITEETLKTFFQNFGEIAYVKIPPHKGYGFVKYVRREDAKQAIIKMNDFPIHEKSRIRLSWGRSLGDKKVEYVKKLSSTLGISFESVWKIVQGQDPAAIKQIVSTVCGRSVGQPYDQSDLPTASALEQLYQVENYSAAIPAVQSNASPMNVFPSVLPTRMTASSIGLAHPNRSPEASGLPIRTDDPRFPSAQVANSELPQEFRQRPPPGRKLESSLPINSRPKALSQGSGSASLPPPSWAMRNSWQELLPPGQFSQQVESPSSVDGIRFPEAEVITSRRATIPSVTPFTFPHDHMSLSQHYQSGSPGSALLSSSQASSTDSLEASTFGFQNVVKDSYPVVKERDEYHLGCDGFLHELLEEEGRDGVAFDREPFTFYKAHPSKPAGDALAPDLSVWSTPSLAKSSPLSERDDWPSTFLGSNSTSESQTVKNIFDSAFKTSSQSHHPREPDDCNKNTPSGRLDTWSFSSQAGSLIKPKPNDSTAQISPASQTGIKSLDSLYTLSL